MTTTKPTKKVLSSADQIQELVTKATEPQKKIDLLTFRLEELEDRSSIEARKIRKQIRAIKDHAGIARTRLTIGSKPAPAPLPDPDEDTTVGEIIRIYRKLTTGVQEAYRRSVIESGLPDPEEVIQRVRKQAGVGEADTTLPHSPACRKCHTIPDPDNRCRKCDRPLCNCSIKDPDHLCRKCRKNQPRIQTSTKNLGKFGRRGK